MMKMTVRNMESRLLGNWKAEVVGVEARVKAVVDLPMANAMHFVELL